MELPFEAEFRELPTDGVDAVGDDEDRAVVPFGNEVAQQPADGAGEEDAFAALSNEGELAIDAGGISGSQSTSRASSTDML